jgi:transcriptional regulator with XRE-family HTH domain
MKESNTQKKSTKPNLTVAQYLTAQIAICGKSQLQIATESGFPKPNMITMLKQGKSKLPFARLGDVATSLGVDPLYLYKLAMNEYDPEAWAVIEPIISKQIILTDNEIELIKLIRDSNIVDPKVESLRDKEIVLEAIGKLKSGR